MTQTLIMQCRHCGNRNPFEKCGEYTKKEFSSREEPDERYYNWVIFTYRLYQCCECQNPTLERTCTSSSEDCFLEEPLFPDEVLYPIESRVLNDIPSKIRDNYKEALKLRKVSPRSCAIMIGLTLETICDYENVQGNTLVEKINSLANSRDLPEQLTAIIHKLRIFRNFGAHNDKYVVQEQDIPLILSLTETLLEYLYVAPTTLKMLKEKTSEHFFR